MRVFQVLEARATGSLPENRTWYRNLHETLVDMGHDVVLMPADEGRTALRTGDAGARDRFSQAMIDRFEAEHARAPFDLVFTYLMDGMADPAAISHLAASGVPVCNFSCNNIHQFGLVERIAPLFTLNLHAERDAAGMFDGVGARHLWWPMASNPKYFAPRHVPELYDATFVGGRYGVRAHYVLGLLDAGLDVHAFGPRWALDTTMKRFRRWGRSRMLLARAVTARSADDRLRWAAEARDVGEHLRLATRHSGSLHPPVDDEELIELYSSSRVSLGFLEVYDAHDPSRGVKKHVHLREFEAPMCGAAYCTQFSDELAGYFEPDVEMMMWSDPAELEEKVRFLIADDGARRRLREAGRRRALSCHTYEHRFRALFEELGLQRTASSSS